MGFGSEYGRITFKVECRPTLCVLLGLEAVAISGTVLIAVDILIVEKLTSQTN